MLFEITGFYGAVLGLVGLILSVQVSIHRGKVGISLGNGDDPELLVKMRRFGNFIENVPFTLLLMGLAEAAGLGATWLYASGTILLVSRLIHPFGLSMDRPAAVARLIGSLGSKVAILIPIVALLAQKFAG